MILILGRFQPLHKGHMKVISDAGKESNNLVIAIGSAGLSHRKKNPFCSDERERMLSSALKEADITAKIVKVEDIPSDDKYVKHVVEIIGESPEHIITENRLTYDLFKSAGFDVKMTHRYFDISATEVRKRMATGENWRSLVPRSVEKILVEIKGVHRVKDLISE